VGAKDLVDTAGIATTWGAEPFRTACPGRRRDGGALHQAGAVLVAKLSLGALALNDIWYGGQTNNPWLPEEGASGSSAGRRGDGRRCVGFALAARPAAASSHRRCAAV